MWTRSTSTPSRRFTLPCCAGSSRTAERTRRSAGLGLLFLGLVGCGERVGTLPPVPPDGVILAFGDSLTHGTGASPSESYPAVLERLSGRTVVNAGRPGELSRAAVERLPELLARHRPALMVLCHGGNDLLRQLDRKQLADNLRVMIGMARAKGVSVVLIGVPRPGLLLEVPDLYREVAQEAGIPADLETLRRLERNGADKSDPIHLNGTGYRKLAEAVDALLREHGAIP